MEYDAAQPCLGRRVGVMRVLGVFAKKAALLILARLCGRIATGSGRDGAVGTAK